jgi:hypothetical protein
MDKLLSEPNENGLMLCKALVLRGDNKGFMKLKGFYKDNSND